MQAYGEELKLRDPEHEKGEEYEDIEHQTTPASLTPPEPLVEKDARQRPKTEEEREFEAGSA
jgi:hypothetical protein